jgi:Fibronectin type III-like domain
MDGKATGTCPPSSASKDKTALLTSADYWHIRGHPGIGLRTIRTSDGLGYSRWEYLSAGVVAPPSARRAAGDTVVRVRLRNAGASYGCETIQVYASRPDSAVERPVRWLAGFAKTEAPPGSRSYRRYRRPVLLSCLLRYRRRHLGHRARGR